MQKFLSLPRIQQFVWVYAVLFYSVVLVGYVPGTKDAHGLLFGLFKIDVRDDVLHTLSGLWATYAAWKSPKAAWFYFRAFGLFYTSDAFLGFFTGFAYVDLVTGNFDANAGYSFFNFAHNLFVNLPHFIIGPIAVTASFVLPQKTSTKNSKKK